VTLANYHPPIEKTRKMIVFSCNRTVMPPPFETLLQILKIMEEERDGSFSD